MIKMFSAEDILELPEFVGLTVFDLINPANDKVIADMLYKVGVDNSKDVEVYPCRHRRLGGKETVNYAYVFWERTDREWLQSPYSSMSARIESQTDGDLKAEMIALSHDSAAMKFKDQALDVSGMRCLQVETYEEDKALIKSLKQVMKQLR